MIAICQRHRCFNHCVGSKGTAAGSACTIGDGNNQAIIALENTCVIFAAITIAHFGYHMKSV